MYTHIIIFNNPDHFLRIWVCRKKIPSFFASFRLTNQKVFRLLLKEEEGVSFFKIN